MPPTQFFSGDMIADRRADYARMLAEGGDPVAAVELMEQALELVPDWAAGWLRLADYAERSGQPAKAVPALERVLMLDPEDIFGASLKLAVLGAAETPDSPPIRYVEALFDEFAERFDETLVDRLDYVVPQELTALILDHAASRSFACAVDLGCGTGLLGQEIRAKVTRLEGFDLSANMLSKAEEKGFYHHLARADLSLDLAASGLFEDGLVPGRADLVTAADVLMYLGDLSAPFALASALAAPGAFFAFSVEDAAADDGFVLRPSLRFAHSEIYVRDQLSAHGFTVIDVRRTTIRMDAGEPVFGILFLAERPA
ncbi:methyltransferase domain-containing protein [Peteryoungia desertarenae]|uniref:Methyltransferase domain-containing protein n=1 Tax=Peteryoungia desertarenae TaxID=1813451 RepID=A0ABX6QSY2_9HYPH|nr:methyltransferase domain-containing protein [Peteryoungia desertarenae]QLF71312.1 methyltransferase domain-containing protein [Peteryoungia desertarenae]